MYPSGYIAVLFTVLSATLGQSPGGYKENVILDLPIEFCQSEGNCQKVDTSITLDSNWRWIHIKDDYVNCYTGNKWDTDYCPDAATCTKNCLLEGVDETDWEATYGVTVDGKGGLSGKFKAESGNIGWRLYLLDEGGEDYFMFKLKNKEFSMEIDVSQLGCGLNGAVYFVEMDADGGMHYPTNKAGAAYGTGYCDAQCPHDLKWINGEANSEDWGGSDGNSGVGHYGSCCVELDIWEANSISSAYTTHPCDLEGPYRCEGTECGDADNRYDGVCDKDGCDYNHWRMGDRTYYGPGGDFQVDTTKPLTYVTQFLTHDGTDNGDLVEIRRLYVQDGKVIANSITDIPGMQSWDSLNDPMCEESKVVFEDIDDHGEKGGLKKMGKSMERGHVLVMSLWDDAAARMLWLDSNYPLDRDPSEPGVSRGSCPTDSGYPEDVEEEFGDASVKYLNIKYGPLGSTFPGYNPTTHIPHPTTAHPCPGGSLENCLSMCPDQPPDVHQGCEQQCRADCK